MSQQVQNRGRSMGTRTRGEFKAYAEYRDTGARWYGQIPRHWDISLLGRLGTISGSGVDKKTREADTPVRMVNYTDVYGNQSRELWSDEHLMKTTAPVTKAEEHSLQRGDILFTPSSETRNEIGVSAVVMEDMPQTVYSYHLTRFRPHADLALGFKKYVANNKAVLGYFESVAEGTTRMTLTQGDFKRAPVLLPPRKEQEAIGAYLDRETAKMDRLIAKKERLIELLEERRTALITKAVTKGLDPDVPMKDSGVEWLGRIPEHWETASCGALFQFLDHMRIPLSSTQRGEMADKTYPYYGASGIIDYVEDFLFSEPLILVAEDGANLLSRSTPLAFIARGKYWVNNHAHVLRPRSGPITYWTYLFRTVDYTPFVEGAAQPKLTQSKLSSIRLPVPPPSEREEIGGKLEERRRETDSLIETTTRAVDLLHEYRSALITAAVTGKIDVRDHAA